MDNKDQKSYIRDSIRIAEDEISQANDSIAAISLRKPSGGQKKDTNMFYSARNMDQKCSKIDKKFTESRRKLEEDLAKTQNELEEHKKKLMYEQK